MDKHCKSSVAAEGGKEGKEGKVGEEERQWVRPARPVSRDHALSGALKTASPQSMVRLLFTVLDTNGDGNLGKASVRECGKGGLQWPYPFPTVPPKLYIALKFTSPK